MNLPPKILDTEVTPSQLKMRLDSGIAVIMPLQHVPTLFLATFTPIFALLFYSPCKIQTHENPST
jgi:hypothetical protein